MIITRLAIFAAALLLAGCAPGTFTTRSSVTLAGDKVLLCNQFGALPCIGSEMDQRDAWAIIEALKAKAAVEALSRALATPEKPAAVKRSEV